MTPVPPLRPDALARTYDLGALAFHTTAQIAPLEDS
jgi:hypothetical protein